MRVDRTADSVLGHRPEEREYGDGPGGQRRRDIVHQAAHLFDAAGYHRTSMEDLAEAVGLAKPTLYHYFSGKEEILYRIHHDFISLLIPRQEERAASGVNPAEQLRGVMGDILELMETHRGHVRVFFEHRRELPAGWQEKIAEQRARYHAMIEAVLESGVAAGHFRPVDIRLVSLMVFGMCNWAYQWYRPDGPMGARQIADHFFELLGRGIWAADSSN